MKRALITGSSGLFGSEAVTFFDARGWDVSGVDNNMRLDFFGPDGDTSSNLERLRRVTRRFTHEDLDIRDREGLRRLVARVRPMLIVHCAAQPSHDLAAERVFDDFDIICYISDLRKFQEDYPDWEITRTLDDILEELGRC